MGGRTGRQGLSAGGTDVTAPTLRTERLTLRAWRGEDLAPFAEMNADPAVMEYFAAPLSPAESDTFVHRCEASFETNGFGLWAVEHTNSHAFIGSVGLAEVGGLGGDHVRLPFAPAVEVGWRLAAAHWGRGYASEAARASLEFGFVERGIGEIVSFTAVINVRSQATMARIGMTRDIHGDFLHPGLDEGNALRPHVLYRITEAHWRAGLAHRAPALAEDPRAGEGQPSEAQHDEGPTGRQGHAMALKEGAHDGPHEEEDDRRDAAPGVRRSSADLDHIGDQPADRRSEHGGVDVGESHAPNHGVLDTHA